jgi:ankyrin repeat protein
MQQDLNCSVKQPSLMDSMFNIVDELKFNLFEAAEKNNIEDLTELLNDPNNSKIAIELILNEKDRRGYYIFHIVAVMGREEIAALLFNHIKTYPPLVSNNVEEQLPTRIASLVDSDNFTPIHYICAEGHEELLQMFIRECNHYDICKALQLKSADTTSYVARSIPLYVSGGKTPIHFAAERNSEECFKIVMGLVAELEEEEKMIQYLFTADLDGNTPLDLALLSNASEEFAQILFDIQKKAGITASTTQDCDKARLLTGEERSQKLANDHKVRAHRITQAKQVDAKVERQKVIEQYKHLHEDLFEPRFNDKFILPSFKQALITSSLSEVVTETSPGVYTFEIFTEEFCQKLVEEMQHFERSGLPIKRPNSMNNYGLILNAIGLEDMCSDIMKEYIEPLSEQLFAISNFKSHHSFIVKYKIGEDLDLDTHIDSSDITMNVCLGKEFTGGSVFFKGVKGSETAFKEYHEWHPTKGKAILHLGRHIHGANKLTSGERLNFIMWCRTTRN